jgi:hypothetical protein
MIYIPYISTRKIVAFVAIIVGLFALEAVLLDQTRNQEFCRFIGDHPCGKKKQVGFCSAVGISPCEVEKKK